MVTSSEPFAIRPATRADLPALGRLGAMLVAAHYAFDRDRFMAPRPNTDRGYASFLGTQLEDDEAVVFVAERGGEIAGYVYASLEPANWKELREAAGFVHDVLVTENGRRLGVASALMRHAIDWLRARGAPRVMLWTASPNEAAQGLFERLGFRRTMVEMTLEL
jgi:ribosomal protein S18 acetylase RimI-like enzyme